MHSPEVAAGHIEIARSASSRRHADRIELRTQLGDRHLLTDIDAGAEVHSFRLELRKTEIEHRLLKLELGDSVAKQSAYAFVLLEDNDSMSGATKLLGCTEAGGPGADHRDAESRPSPRRTRHHPTLRKAAIGDCLLDVTDGDGLIHQAEHARRFARRGTEAPGELGEIVRGMQRLERLAPITALNQTVPFRDDVAHGTARVALAKRHSAIHAARGLSLHG